jgi:hypothetical protein
MIQSLELAGFFAAHAVWCVSEGETLIPMLAYKTKSNERRMDRLIFDDLGAAVQAGKQKLEANEMNADSAALLYDGRIPINNKNLDAIIVEIRDYQSPNSCALMVVPYSPKSLFRRFLIHRPKLLQWKDCEGFDMNSALEAFFVGVDQHEKGAKVWNQALDQSK